MFIAIGGPPGPYGAHIIGRPNNQPTKSVELGLMRWEGGQGEGRPGDMENYKRIYRLYVYSRVSASDREHCEQELHRAHSSMKQ